ncbi:hypothetical protein [Amorphus sp. 3PC139-8]|uniref:hypothetical protein n=1 Tax=Amorphus sp. 3PC139-8 TaxID=2735676 RepID=UPI00345CFA9D
MAASNDPSDPKSGKDRRNPPVIDLPASEVREETAPKAAGTSGKDQKPGAGSSEPPSQSSGKAKADEMSASSGDKPSDTGSGKPSADQPKSDSEPADTAEATGAAKTAASQEAKDGETPKDSSTGGESQARPRTSGVPTTGPRNGEDASEASETPAAADAPQGAGRDADDDDDDVRMPPQEITIVRRGSGFGGLVLAALFGAVVTLAGGFIVLKNGIVTLENAASSNGGLGAELRGRIAGLEDRLRSGSQGASDEIENLKSSLASVQSNLHDRVSNLESSVQSSQSAPAVTPDEVNALKTSLTNVADQSGQALNTAKQAAADADKANATISQINRSLDAIQTSEGSLKTTLDNLSGTVSNLSGTVSSLSSTASDLSGRVAAIEKQLGGPGPRETAALAVATAMLDQALRTGAPFTAELAAVTSRVDDPALIAPLKPFADKGLMTRQALIDAYPEVTTAVYESVRGSASQDGFVSGLLANAESLVRIRRTGEAGGGGVGATLDQIRSDLDDGNLSAAADAWQNLPEPAKAASKEWHDQLAARAAADQLVKKVGDDVLASLAQTDGGGAAPAASSSATPGN